jgi:hypothetical protein
LTPAKLYKQKKNPKNKLPQAQKIPASTKSSCKQKKESNNSHKQKNGTPTNTKNHKNRPHKPTQQIPKKATQTKSEHNKEDDTDVELSNFCAYCLHKQKTFHCLFRLFCPKELIKKSWLRNSDV